MFPRYTNQHPLVYIVSAYAWEFPQKKELLVVSELRLKTRKIKILKMICWLSGYCRNVHNRKVKASKTHILIPSYYVRALNLNGVHLLSLSSDENQCL